MKSFSLTLSINVEDIVDSISSYQSAKDLILSVDLKIADTGFTEDIIKELFKSLMVDYSNGEMKKLIKELSELLKGE